MPDNENTMSGNWGGLPPLQPALGAGLADLVRRGHVAGVIPRALPNRIQRDGVHVRLFSLAPGERVPCAAFPGDDLMILVLRADFRGGRTGDDLVDGCRRRGDRRVGGGPGPRHGRRDPARPPATSCGGCRPRTSASCSSSSPGATAGRVPARSPSLPAS